MVWSGHDTFINSINYTYVVIRIISTDYDNMDAQRGHLHWKVVLALSTDYVDKSV